MWRRLRYNRDDKLIISSGTGSVAEDVFPKLKTLWSDWVHAFNRDLGDLIESL